MNYNNNTIENKTLSSQKEDKTNNKEIKRKIKSNQPSNQIKKSRFVNVSSSNPPFFNFPLKNLSELTKRLNIEEIINILSHPKIEKKTSFITLNNEQLFGKECALFYKKTIKNKVNLYCSFNENLGKGAFGDVVLGYKLNVDEKKIKEKAIKYSTNRNLLEESHSLDALYNTDKKLKFIQKRFKTLDFKDYFMLITKRYEGNLCNLMKKKTLTLFQQFHCFKQMTLGVYTIIKSNFIALDIKIQNTLYKEKKTQLKLFFRTLIQIIKT